MADEGTVNSQITDSVTQAIAAVLGHSVGETTGMLDTLMAETVGMAMYNAVTTQHNSQMVSSAAVTAACARMLKMPAASTLPYKLVAPVVNSILPVTVEVNAESQTIQVFGSNFQQGLTVDFFDSEGTQIGSLDGTLQISDVTANSFTMQVNLLAEAGNYGMEVVNPDGGRSSRFQIQVNPVDPVVSNVSPSLSLKPNSYQVTGRHFQKSLNAEVFDHTGTLLTGTTASDISPTSFNLVIPPGGSAGPFGVEVVHTDGRRSGRFLFAARANGSTSLARVGDGYPS